MTELQSKLLEILKALDTICRKHDIEYFLTGGSALGAIRHKGFIPWDDDIDVGMTRPMWDLFREAALKELPDNLQLVDHISHPTYCNHIAKIVDRDSTAIYRISLADGCPKGQYLEIFIHDYVPEDKVTEHKKKFLAYCELMTPYMSVFSEKLDFKGGLKDDDIEAYGYYRELNDKISSGDGDKDKAAVMDVLEKEMAAYPADGSERLLLEWGENTLYYIADNFRDLRRVPFEDMEAPVPACACDNLRIDYGNSWKNYPPASGRAHHVTIGDGYVPAEIYMDMIGKQIDLEKTRSMRAIKNEREFDSVKDRAALDKDLLEIQMEHALITEQRTEGLADLYERGEYAKICEIFDGYIKLKRKINKYSSDKDLSPETRGIIAKALVMLGRLDDAEAVMSLSRLILMRECKPGTETDIVCIERAETRYYDGLYEEAEEFLGKVSDGMRRSLPYRKVRTRLDLAAGKKPESIEDLMAEFPDDLELVKLEADILMAGGKEDKAKELYKTILSKSDNGMDILDACKALGKEA